MIYNWKIIIHAQVAPVPAKEYDNEKKEEGTTPTPF